MDTWIYLSQGFAVAMTPENLVIWLRDPQKVVPGNAMPNLNLTDEQSRDIAAYLSTLR